MDDSDSDDETIPGHSPGGSRCLSPMTDPNSAASASGRHGDGFGRRRRCVTMSVLPDVVALDTEDEEEEVEEDGEGDKEKGEEGDVLWMASNSKDGAGVEMRARSKTSPACMRWYVERQVGRSLRRISDDFVTNIGLREVIRVGNVQQSNVNPRQPEVRPDSHALPVATSGSLPVSSSSSSRDSLWSRMSSYFHPERTRTQQSNRADTNSSNSLPTGAALDEVFMAPADVESLRTVAMQ